MESHRIHDWIELLSSKYTLISISVATCHPHCQLLTKTTSKRIKINKLSKN